jgi:hypothetical protein
MLLTFIIDLFKYMYYIIRLNAGQIETIERGRDKEEYITRYFH